VFEDEELGLFCGEPGAEKLMPLEDIDGAAIEYSQSLIWVTCRAWPPIRFGI
jgi:hypothetical protein